MRRRDEHRHVCAAGCGDVYVCTQPADHCPVAWTCPACEQDQRDEYFQQVAHLREHIREAKTSHEPQ